MTPERVQRKLTTILAADIEGYTRLMRADEESTFSILGEYLEIIVALIARHEGRVFKSGGDSVLAEFGSAVEAVRCAVAFQEEIASRNAELADDRKLVFRIGINVGDVIVKGDDLIGDGVNVAARLEGLARPGGICISGSVFEQIRHKLSLAFEDLGPQRVKNIAEPVSAYGLALGLASVSNKAPSARKAFGRKRWRMMAMATLAMLALVASGWGWWWQAQEPNLKLANNANEVAPLIDRPSIAVMPFTNMSDSAEQEYFADGMTDDLITRISKISSLIVISRTTAFTFKGKDLKTEAIAQELGVNFVLEGSVRRAGGKVRINAQLIDGSTGSHIWAETFDRPYIDIFALQDEVQARIVEALKVRLTAGEKREIARRPTVNLEAYEFYLKAEQLRLGYSWAEFVSNDAFSFYDRALALDPEFIAAHIGSARAGIDFWRFGVTDFGFQSRVRNRTQHALQRALALAPDNAEALGLQARMQLYLLNHDLALSLMREAVERHPEDPEARVTLALVLLASDRPEEAREAYAHAVALSPKPSPELLLAAGEGYLLLGETEKSTALFERARDGGINGLFTAPYLAAAYSRLGDLERARKELAAVRQTWTWVNAAWYRVSLAHFRNGQRVRDYMVDPLLKAGLSEWPFGFQGTPMDRLRDADLDALFRGSPRQEIFGHVAYLYLNLHDGNGNWQSVRPGDHSIVLQSGTNVIKDDMLCIRTEAAYMGRETCSEVYRNPGGSPDTSDEFIRTDLYTLRRFSIKQMVME